MYHEDRAIYSKEIIRAVLDMCDVLNIGFFDTEYPYVLPVNFGYEFKDDLIFYTHHAPEGYKNELIEKNPKVCVVAYKFVDRRNSTGKLIHDYRSVMAFGEISAIEHGSAEYGKAWASLAACNGRSVPETVFAPDFGVMMCKIFCPAKNVIGKAQYPVTSLEQVPFPDI